MGIDTTNPVFRVCEQQRSRLACESVQTDQHLCYSLFGKNQYLNLLQAKGDVLLMPEISLKVICEKVKFSNCDYCNTFSYYEWTYKQIIQKVI